MDKKIIITAVAIAAIILVGIGLFFAANNKKNAAAPIISHETRQKMDAISAAALEKIKGEAGLAFSAPAIDSFLWYLPGSSQKNRALAITGLSMAVFAATSEESAALTAAMGKLDYSADAKNTVRGYNARRDGFKKDLTVCVVESAPNLSNYQAYSPGAQPAGALEIKVYCGQTGTPDGKTKLEKFTGQTSDSETPQFDACDRALFPVIKTMPKQCVAPGNIFFEVETCGAPGGPSITLDEAIAYAERSECLRESSLKNTHVCDAATGDWRIDILTYRANCHPVCVISAATKEAKIDWNCATSTQE